MRRRNAAAVGLLLLLLAACGGGDDTEATDTGATLTAPAWAASVLREPGPEGAAILAGTDFAVGRTRVTFLLVRANGSLIQAPEADVVHRPDPGAPPVRVPAKLTSFGVSGAAGEDARSFYVAELELAKPGKTWLVIEPRGVEYQGFQVLDVAERSQAVGLGERAPASVNPTVADRPAKEITTARPPDTGLLRHTVADSLRAAHSVRRHLRHARLLQEPHLRPDRRRGRQGAPPVRGRGDPLHPHRDLRGQPARQRQQPVGAGMGPAERAVGLRRRPAGPWCVTASRAPSRSTSSTPRSAVTSAGSSRPPRNGTIRACFARCAPGRSSCR